MKRTQLYLDDELWDALHAQARQHKTTISDLVRRAARERYLGSLERRREVMRAFVGSRKGRNLPDSVEYVRNLRRVTRLKRLQEI